jgi:hypothetical protein
MLCPKGFRLFFWPVLAGGDERRSSSTRIIKKVEHPASFFEKRKAKEKSGTTVEFGGALLWCVILLSGNVFTQMIW